jgi:site-specific DNA recombinase
MVDDETFLEVQSILKKKKVSVHYVEKLDHPLRGFVRCAHCERVYTPYVKKGILYFNSRCVKGCINKMKNCNFDYVTEKTSGLIAKLNFTEDELADLDARTSTDISLLEERRIKSIEQMERKKKRIREDLAYLHTNRLSLLKSGAYTPEGIVAEEERLQSELVELQEQENTSDVAMAELMKEVVILSELIRNVVPVYDFAKPHEKERISRVIFSELFVAHDTLQYKLKKGFEPFSDHLSALCDPTENRTPISRMKTWRPNR